MRYDKKKIKKRVTKLVMRYNTVEEFNNVYFRNTI